MGTLLGVPVDFKNPTAFLLIPRSWNSAQCCSLRSPSRVQPCLPWSEYWASRQAAAERVWVHSSALARNTYLSDAAVGEAAQPSPSVYAPPDRIVSSFSFCRA